MAFICEDLAEYGVVLVPPSSPEYFELLADIERRLAARPEGAPPMWGDASRGLARLDTDFSAILVNRADTAIASIAYSWADVMTCLPGTNPSVLLPFDVDPRWGRVQSFWHTIFPGSKRLMTSAGDWFGDNTEVRPPAADELSHGGWSGVGPGSSSDRPKPTKLTLDGVFFVDGGFAGPNRLGSWEHTVFAAEAYLECGKLARDVGENGKPAAAFFAQLQAITGAEDGQQMRSPIPHYWRSQPLDPEPIRIFEREMVGCRALQKRKMLGDEEAIIRIARWADAPVPKFHKL